MSLTTCSPRRPRDMVRRVVLGACVAVGALVGLPAIASASSSCVYNSTSKVVSIIDGSGSQVPLHIGRSSSDAIVFGDSFGFPTRSCGIATIFNTSRINVTKADGITPLDGVVVDYSQGLLSPGVPVESDGLSEIEVVINNTATVPGYIRVVGTAAGDTLRAAGSNRVMVGPDGDQDIAMIKGSTVAPASFIEFDGGGGDDYLSGRGGAPASFPEAATVPVRLFGEFGKDVLVDGKSLDLLVGGPADDVLNSNDGNINHRGELNDGGDGFDTAFVDGDDAPMGADLLTFIEKRFVGGVGRLRLSPTTVNGKPGSIAKLELRWTHPKAWKELKTLAVRLYRGTSKVGTITLNPRTERMRGEGKLALVTSASRVTHEGKAAVARLAVRVPKSVRKGQMRVDVEATDRHGQQQLEPSAGLIKIK